MLLDSISLKKHRVSTSRDPHTEGVVASETQIHARTEHTNEAPITRLYNEHNRSPAHRHLSLPSLPIRLRRLYTGGQKSKSRPFAKLVRHGPSCSRESQPDLGSGANHAIMLHWKRDLQIAPEMNTGMLHVFKYDFLGRELRSRLPDAAERDCAKFLAERDDAHGVWVFRRCNGEHGAVL